MAAITKALDIPVLASGGALDYVTREDLPEFKTAVGMNGGWAGRLAAPSRLIILPLQIISLAAIHRRRVLLQFSVIEVLHIKSKRCWTACVCCCDSWHRNRFAIAGSSGDVEPVNFPARGHEGRQGSHPGLLESGMACELQIRCPLGCLHVRYLH
jgi:hypothetical protein